MPGAASYQGGTRFLRWWPPLLLLLAGALLLSGWNHATQFATLLAFCAVIHAGWLPWQFVVGGDGLVLAFPFGRRRFLPKHRLRVRIETVGVIAFVGRRHRFGYLLFDKVLYEPGREDLLRTAFTDLGYRIG
jgi:hypothetical protein